MSNQKSDLSDVEIREGDEQHRDSMLLKLLKTPPQPRPKRTKEKQSASTKGKRKL